MKLISSAGVPVKVADDRAEFFIKRMGFRRPEAAIKAAPAPVPRVKDETPVPEAKPSRRRRKTAEDS